MLLRKRFNQIELLMNLIIISLLLVIFIKLHYQINIKYSIPTYFEIINSHYKAILLIMSFWILLIGNFNYLSLSNLKFYKQLGDTGKVFILFSLFIFTISGVKSEELLSINLILCYLSITFLLILFVKLFLFFLLKNFFKNGKYTVNAIIVGNNDNVDKLIATLKNRKDLGINIVKILDDKLLEKTDIKQLFKNNDIQIIYIAQNGLNYDYLYKELYELALLNHMEINYIPYAFEEKVLSFSVNYIDTLPIYTIKKYPLEQTNNQIVKSLFDIIFSSLVCVFILSWLFPIIALLIKLDSKGSVIFKQKRRGINGKDFDCYKFRTMRNDGTNSIKATVVNDNRITKIGNFLRKTSLDELPQFINVLKGDMSIVGPRPHMISQDIYYSEIIRKYNLRNYVKPGITGLSQVKGYRGAIDCDKDMEDRIRTDIFYVRNWSLLLDIQIIYQTVVLVFKGDENAI
ncbi:exopolysaccharide biosynthesis polyprenyl glycosylphosphotransferase [Empedobacter sp. 225-1]|uniref:exopolysaccharide biosynthesis polyprenyl glycosylphosphotransferase n=1 Tax=unclassified Empedobacter TaxID=2643773 RepID=UPI0025756339|nr:exopolysaccharide biosynthesis polyprenyl glycosylphosphotransferase [Empedobacter sp. 225-1]MDM1522345.1 exopolysaccharide biosynthesis polyprenyl glycosylphosphotransferase [Empedobacter sp. 225-1]MDM1541842.1 exopolysaccharide biosynthesis polyprenyl glycosylphosphotransferase [Empedobacter sp. 189-2]